MTGPDSRGSAREDQPARQGSFDRPPVRVAQLAARPSRANAGAATFNDSSDAFYSSPNVMDKNSISKSSKASGHVPSYRSPGLGVS